ncbi:MAG: CPBP family intramembrane glutamic endopeptidase [Thermoplasmatota archaeon]
MERKKENLPIGSGPIPRSLIIFTVSALLALNMASLISSIVPVTEGVMEGFASGTWGEVALPYVPNASEGIRICLDEEPEIWEPFSIWLIFPGNDTPYIEHRLMLSNHEMERSLPTWRSFREGIPVLCAYSNGLPLGGSWNAHLSRNLGGSIQQIPLGEIHVGDGGDALIFPVPAEDGMGFGKSGIEFIASGPAASTEREYDYTVENSQGQKIKGNVRGENFTIPATELGGGWNRITIEGQNGTSLNRKYLFHNTLASPALPSIDRIFVRRVFNGYDELYGQDPEDWFGRDSNGSLKLYRREYYLINVTLDESSAVTNIPLLPPLELSVSIDGKEYPLFIKDSNAYKGIFLVPHSFREANEMSVISSPYGGDRTVLELMEVRLKRDRASVVHIDPDPFGTAFYEGDLPKEVSVKLFAEWANFNRKDFKGHPKVELGNGSLDHTEEESLFLHEKNYTMTLQDVLSGQTLIIRSETVFEFGTLLTFILPGPNIIYYVPFPLEGSLVLIWFFLITLSIMAAVSAIFLQSAGFMERRKGKSSALFSGLSVRRFFEPRSSIFITAKTFAGAFFFFYMSVLMFNIFETPTPGLDILSSDTPIWMRMFTLAEASVWEEITGRVLLIGLPVALYGLIKGKGISSFKAMVGGTGHFGSLEVMLIFLSGSLFGMAHLGWGPWKVLPTFVHGLMFGYLFVKVGLHAAIAMHFLFDYTSFFSEIYHVQNFVYISFIFIMLILGGIYLGELVRRAQLWFASRTFKRFSRPELLLAVHSLLSLLLAWMLISEGKGLYYVPFFMIVPLFDLTAYWLSEPRTISRVLGFFDLNDDRMNQVIRRIMDSSGRFICYFISYFSLIGAPFGFAWVARTDDR